MEEGAVPLGIYWFNDWFIKDRFGVVAPLRGDPPIKPSLRPEGCEFKTRTLKKSLAAISDSMFVLFQVLLQPFNLQCLLFCVASTV